MSNEEIASEAAELCIDSYRKGFDHEDRIAIILAAIEKANKRDYPALPERKP